MARCFAKIVVVLSLVTLFMLFGCSNNKEEFPIKKIEISKITFNGAETFDTDKIRIEKAWTLNDNKSMSTIWNKAVIGNLEPRCGKPIDKDYDAYYVRIFLNENSFEE